jgi:hypothetical protein
MQPIPPAHEEHATAVHTAGRLAAHAHARGWAHLLRLLLPMLEPVAPLGAQVLYVGEPALNVLGARGWLRDLAQVLETPGGLAELDDALDDPPGEAKTRRG